MEILLIIAGVVILFLTLHMKFGNYLEKRSKEQADDLALNQIYQFIDDSLKGYPDRVRYVDVYGTHVWTCHSRLFRIQIQLQKEQLRYNFRISFFCELPFQFRLRRSLTGAMKVDSSSGKTTRKMLAQKEIPALIQKLRFYDSVDVSSSGLHASTRFGAVAGLSEWPRTLGASITFVRFLLNYEQRVETTNQEQALCPYCRGPVAENEGAVSCGNCRTVHHQDCWNETNQCSVFGCGGKRELEL